MPLRHLVVTPLPNGKSGNTAFLAVHLSPRLREDGVLSDYPDFGDWGQFAISAPLEFHVLLNGKPLPPAAVSVVSPPVNPQVWQAVFGNPASKVPVERFTFLDRVNLDIRSIDSGRLTELLMALVKAMAELGGAATKAEIEAAAGELFDLLPAARRYFTPTGNDAEPAAPSNEFHDQLGLLGAHPFLMRVLGLVYDLEVTLPAAVPNEVAVRTSWRDKAGGLVAPRDEIPMRVAVDAGFKAAVLQPEFRTSDWLTLGGRRYEVAQLDLINATSQFVHLADDLAGAPSPESPIEVPALLESGMSIIHKDLADVLRARLDRQREIEDGIDRFITGLSNTPPLLSAEHTTLGYRYDVEDQSLPGFRSLHDRQAAEGYVFPRDKSLTVTPPQDEGWGSIALHTDGGEAVSGVATPVRYQLEGSSDIPKAEQRDETAWRIDDHLMTWGGWSLSTPRVGSSTTGAGEVKPREPNVPAPDSPVQIVADYAHVNGTLPKLRYGRSYTFRARCVDLAGNGPQLGDVAPGGATSPVALFGRLAPLSAPLVIRRESRPDPGVGDLPDVLVIKSELRQSNASTSPTDRLLFPPRISQSRLERHDLPDGGNDPAAYAELARHDARALEDQTLVDPETGELVAGTTILDGQVTAGPTEPPVEFLADPVAGGVAFHNLPGADPGVPLLMSYGAWPDVAALQLELRAGAGAPNLVPLAKRVTVNLPKGTIAIAELSHAPDPPLLSHMALAQGLSDRTEALNGLNRSISGRRGVTFVHAVRLPLLAPSFTGDMAFSRTDVGQTDIGIEGTFGVHRATTEHVALCGRWVDTVDVRGTDRPKEQVTRRIVRDLPIGLEGPDTTELVDEFRVDFGDTKRRLVDIGAEAFCRFSRYFTERIDFTRESDTVVLCSRGVTPRSVVFSNLTTGEVFERDRHYAVDRTLGTLTVLDTAAIPVGMRCRVEFIPLPVSRLSTQAPAGTTFRCDVPASAPPTTPRVLAVLPAFNRQVVTSDRRIVVRHDGRVVRLHLDRPWFTSGAGEVLGVALDNAPAATPVLTRWGRDPLTDSTGASIQPGIDQFPAATEQAVAVDGRFDVAGHDIIFDNERKIWLADVQIDATFGYRPFVRLHVCRYQPLALHGQHLSGTVELDPIRLGAERQVVVSRLSGSRAGVRLTGNDNVNVVTVILQEADQEIIDPDLKWHDVDSVVLTRSGTTESATHSGTIDIPTSGKERRLLIEDAEPLTVEEQGALTSTTAVSYREVLDIPANW